MYGTRDAASNWEKAYTEFLQKVGFKVGNISPCIFHHDNRKLRLVVHGDDFTIIGPEQELDWFRTQITQIFEVKFNGGLDLTRRMTKVSESSTGS